MTTGGLKNSEKDRNKLKQVVKDNDKEIERIRKKIRHRLSKVRMDHQILKMK